MLVVNPFSRKYYNEGWLKNLDNDSSKCINKRGKGNEDKRVKLGSEAQIGKYKKGTKHFFCNFFYYPKRINFHARCCSC